MSRRPSLGLTPLEPRDCPSTVHIATDRPTALTSTPLRAGQSVTLTAVMQSTDGDELAEGEPLVVQQAGRTVALIRPDGLPHTLTITAATDGERPSAYIRSYDGDEWADIRTGGLVVPTQLHINRDGSVDYSYTTPAGVAAGIPIGLAWQGSGFVTRLMATATVSGVAGAHRVHVPAADLVTAPAGATGLAVVADPWNQLRLTDRDAQTLVVPVSTHPLTAGQLRAAMPGLTAPQAAGYAPLLDRAMAEFGIRTLEQRAMFLGQIAHESADLTRWDEVGNPDRYHGRGPIQLTGRDNYDQAGRYFNVDLVGHPEKVASDRALGLRIAAWYWQTEYNHHLNATADRAGYSTSWDFTVAVTRVINPGEVRLNDIPRLTDRLDRYRRARSILLDPSLTG